MSEKTTIKYRWDSIVTSLLCFGAGLGVGSSITVAIVAPALIK